MNFIVHNQSFAYAVNDLLNKKTCLSTLLPYDLGNKTRGNLRTALKEYRMLLETFSKTIEALKKSEWEKFDALVGENACQIRAIWIALLAKNNSINCSYLEKIIIKNKILIDEFLLPKNINSLMSTDISFKELLKQEKLSIALTEDELFLLKSYLLSETKATNIKDKIFQSVFVKEFTNPKKLKKYGEVSTAFLEKLIKNSKIMLSYKSVEFVKKIILNFKNPFLTLKLLEDFKVEHKHLYCIPIYWSIKAMIWTMFKNKIPLIIHVKFVDKSENDKFTIRDEDFLFFIAENDNNKNYNFIEVPFNTIEQDNPVIVFEGIVQCKFNNIKKHKDLWRTLVSSSDITTVILANAAAHRQYPEANLNYLIDNLNDKEYENHKVLAEKIGLSINNPTNFLLRHIYTSKLENLSIT